MKSNDEERDGELSVPEPKDGGVWDTQMGSAPDID
jgi:hypothetical protein